MSRSSEEYIDLIIASDDDRQLMDYEQSMQEEEVNETSR